MHSSTAIQAKVYYHWNRDDFKEMPKVLILTAFKTSIDDKVFFHTYFSHLAHQSSSIIIPEMNSEFTQRCYHQLSWNMLHTIF